jgi:hypothetical protein
VLFRSVLFAQLHQTGAATRRRHRDGFQVASRAQIGRTDYEVKQGIERPAGLEPLIPPLRMAAE